MLSPDSRDSSCLSKPGCHIPSASCCASVAPDTDSRVCFERGWLCCAHSATGPSLSGFVPAVSVGALASSARCGVHPPRRGVQAAKRLAGMSSQLTEKKPSLRTFWVAVWSYFKSLSVSLAGRERHESHYYILCRYSL